MSLGITTIVFGALTLASIWTIDEVARIESERDAVIVGEFSGSVAIKPYLTEGLLGGEPKALAAMRTAANTLTAHPAVDHVKIWSDDGIVLWADDERLIGEKFDFEPSEVVLLLNGGASAELSPLDRLENALDVTTNGSGRLLEVYYAAETDTGEPLLVETYISDQFVSDRASWIRHRLLPVALGGLAVLALSQVPVTVLLARRLGQAGRRNAQMFGNEIDRRDAERRRIAGEVHDGAVQELVGVTFGLAAIAQVAPPGISERITAIGDETRRTVDGLRSLLSSIYPVCVPAEGWAAGLDDVITTLQERGTDVTICVPDLVLSHADQLLLLRVSREALRNVSTHADARHVMVSLARSADTVVLDVSDDGMGFSPAVPGGPSATLHFGLRLMADLATEAGARLSIRSRPNSGANIRLELPVRQ